MRLPNHRQCNHILSAVVAVCAIYILLLPLLPNIVWGLKKHSPIAPYGGGLAVVSHADPTPQTAPLPKENRIVIPSAEINLPILEGDGVWVIDKGGSLRKNVWVDSPLKDGNTVIIGHRFSYKYPNGGFYYLDKVHVGDPIAVYWQGQELLYKVVETKIVPQTAVEIENNTTDRTLTLYTCTPVYTSDNRIVVIAKPMEVK